jgi:hypothetical protein
LYFNVLENLFAHLGTGVRKRPRFSGFSGILATVMATVNDSRVVFCAHLLLANALFEEGAK